jgi:Methyltransferase domain
VVNLYPRYRWEFDYVLDHVQRDTRLFEIGCGDGVFLKKCRDRQISAKGFDFSRDAIQACRDAGLDAELVDVSSGPAPGEKTQLYETFVGFHTLEHVCDPHSVFHLANQHTAPEAEMWLAIPSHRRPSRKFRERDFLDQPPHHMTRWTGKALRLVGVANGWRLRDIAYEPMSIGTALWWYATRHPVYKSVTRSRLFKKGAGEKLVRLLLYPVVLPAVLVARENISGHSMIAHYQRQQ